MAIAEVVVGLIDGQLEEIARMIEADYKSAVASHNKWQGSGAAVKAIHIEKRGNCSYFIGAKVGSNREDGGLHLHYLDEGNGGRNAVIKPKRAKALGTPPDGIPGIGFRASVHGYDGFGITAEIASKYNG